MIPHPVMLSDPVTVKIGSDTVTYQPEGSNPVHEGEPVVGDEWEAGLEGQFLVGMNVAGKPTWKPAQVRDFIEKERRRQIREGARARGMSTRGLDVGGSITPMLGFWSKVSRHDASEKAVSALVLHMPSAAEDEDDFRRNMRELALSLTKHFDQDAVILRLAKAGLVEKVIQTAWPRKK